MIKRILPFVHLMLFCVVTTGHATIHEGKNELQPLVDSDLDSFSKSNDNLKNFHGAIFNKHNDGNRVYSPYDTIAQNNKSEFVLKEEDIRRVQDTLNKLGYDAGRVDGLAHNRTVNAIVDLQRKEGLPVTGEIDQQLLEFLEIR